MRAWVRTVAPWLAAPNTGHHVLHENQTPAVPAFSYMQGISLGFRIQKKLRRDDQLQCIPYNAKLSKRLTRFRALFMDMPDRFARPLLEKWSYCFNGHYSK